MKKWIYNLPIKFFALLLASLCFFCAVVSGVGILALLETDGYRDDGKTMTESVLERRFSYVPYDIAELYHNGSDYLTAYLADLRREIDCEYDILHDGSLHGNRSERDFVASVTETVVLPPDYPYSSQAHYQVTLYLFEPAEGSDLELMLQIMLFFCQIRYGLIAICASCAAGFVLLFIFLCISAGKKGSGEASFNFFHRVPLEVYLLGGAIALLLEVAFFDVFSFSLFFLLLFGLPIVFADAFLLLLFVMTFAVRCKRRRFFETTLLGKVFRVLSLLWQDLKLVPKVGIVMICLGALDLFLAALLGFHGAMAVYLV
ncbi:MAG: hypothetical protein IJC26_02965, partial [Clostridia bacterium]|nr:hypothetical protein [Clostridia bacterium]